MINHFGGDEAEAALPGGMDRVMMLLGCCSCSWPLYSSHSAAAKNQIAIVSLLS